MNEGDAWYLGVTMTLGFLAFYPSSLGIALAFMLWALWHTEGR